MGFALHMPLLLQQWNLLPDWSSINFALAIALVASTLVGSSLAAFLYLNENITKPIRLNPQFLQDFFAYDFYTAKLYRLTIVFVVGLVSRIIYWFDRYIVDGVVNLVGMATLFSGQILKYNVSGQTQFYVLSILLGTALFGLVLCWPFLLQMSLVISF